MSCKNYSSGPKVYCLLTSSLAIVNPSKLANSSDIKVGLTDMLVPGTIPAKRNMIIAVPAFMLSMISIKDRAVSVIVIFFFII